MSKYYTKDENGAEVMVEAFSQAELEEIINRRLGRERAHYADYEQLKESASAHEQVKADYEAKLAEAVKEKEELVEKLRLAHLDTERTKILREFNINEDLAEFVTGDDADQMRARAEKLSHSTVAGSVEIQKEVKPVATKSDIENLADSLFGNETN